MDIRNNVDVKARSATREITFIVPLHRMHLKKFDSTFQSLLDSKIESISFKTIVVLNGQVKKEVKSSFLSDVRYPITGIKYELIHRSFFEKIFFKFFWTHF